MKSGLVWGSFLCIICLYMKLPGGPDGPDPPDGAGGAGRHLGGGLSIWLSPDGEYEAIDILTLHFQIKIEWPVIWKQSLLELNGALFVIPPDL